MSEIVHKTAGFRHQDNSWEIAKVSVRIDRKAHKIEWPPRVKYKGVYYNLIEHTLQKRPMYIQEVTCTDLVPVETSVTPEKQIQYLERFCEKQNNQIVALVHRVRELEREIIEFKKGSNESQT